MKLEKKKRMARGNGGDGGGTIMELQNQPWIIGQTKIAPNNMLQ